MGKNLNSKKIYCEIKLKMEILEGRGFWKLWQNSNFDHFIEIKFVFKSPP